MGDLIIKIFEARNLADGLKSSVFCRVRPVGDYGRPQQTKMMKKTDNPIWNQQFQFKLRKQNIKMLYEVVKDKTFGEGIIGVVEVAIGNLIPSVPSDMWLQFSKSGVAVHTELTFVPDIELQTNLVLQKAASRSSDLISTGGAAVLRDLNTAMGTATPGQGGQQQVVYMTSGPGAQPQPVVLAAPGQRVVMAAPGQQVMMQGQPGQVMMQGQMMQGQQVVMQGQPGQQVMMQGQPGQVMMQGQMMQGQQVVMQGQPGQVVMQGQPGQVVMQGQPGQPGQAMMAAQPQGQVVYAAPGPGAQPQPGQPMMVAQPGQAPQMMMAPGQAPQMMMAPGQAPQPQTPGTMMSVDGQNVHVAAPPMYSQPVGYEQPSLYPSVASAEVRDVPISSGDPSAPTFTVI